MGTGPGALLPEKVADEFLVKVRNCALLRLMLVPFAVVAVAIKVNIDVPTLVVDG